MAKRAALILAGGKARRFQGKGAAWEDKALASLSGVPLLIHAVRSVVDVVDEVAVCVDDAARGARYRQILEANSLANAKIVVDEECGVSGPTVAIASGLRGVKAPRCLTLPCDMPFLQPKVADYLFALAEGFDVATPMWPNGRLETLLNVFEKQRGLEIAETLCGLKRPRSDDIQRGASKLLLVSTVAEVKKLDPELRSFVNINSQEDLKHPRTRPAHGPVTENLNLDIGPFSTVDLQCLREGAKAIQENRFSQAEKIFDLSAAAFEADSSFFWAAVSRENQGETLLALSKQQVEAERAAAVDFEGKESFVKSADNYRQEAEFFECNPCRLLAERALADKAWAESWAMGKHSHIHRYPPKVA